MSLRAIIIGLALVIIQTTVLCRDVNLDLQVLSDKSGL